MKISIITPIYNEAKSIKRYFKALNQLNYPKEDFEILIINDGSTDNSLNLTKEQKENCNFNLRIIDFKKNQGWIVARETGAKEAKYENILFFDCKCEIFPNALKKIKKLNYQPLIGNALQKNNHIYDRFFYLIRKKRHRSHFNQDFQDFFINEKNFDTTGKGTTVFFCKKALFLNSQPKNKHNKHVSDDIKLLWNILQKKAILKTSEIKVYYNTRTTFNENFKHMISRGPRFADYYYRPSKKFFWLINAAFLIILLAIYLLIAKDLYFKVLLALLIANAAISLYLAEKAKDFFISFLLLPILGSAFLYGIIKGLVLKPLHAKNK